MGCLSLAIQWFVPLFHSNDVAYLSSRRRTSSCEIFKNRRSERSNLWRRNSLYDSLVRKPKPNVHTAVIPNPDSFNPNPDSFNHNPDSFNHNPNPFNHNPSCGFCILQILWNNLAITLLKAFQVDEMNEY
jgi:hypothetical protein